MSPIARRALTLSVLTVAFAVAIGGFDLHREILRAAWPVIESFWFTYIAF